MTGLTLEQEFRSRSNGVFNDTEGRGTGVTSMGGPSTPRRG